MKKLQLAFAESRDAIFNDKFFAALEKFINIKPTEYLYYMDNKNLPKSYYEGIWYSLQLLAKRFLESEDLYLTDKHYIQEIDNFTMFFNISDNRDIFVALSNLNKVFMRIDPNFFTYDEFNQFFITRETSCF